MYNEKEAEYIRKKLRKLIEEGISYEALIEDNDSDECSLFVYGIVLSVTCKMDSSCNIRYYYELQSPSAVVSIDTLGTARDKLPESVLDDIMFELDISRDNCRLGQNYEIRVSVSEGNGIYDGCSLDELSERIQRTEREVVLTVTCRDFTMKIGVSPNCLYFQFVKETDTEDSMGDIMYEDQDSVDKVIEIIQECAYQYDYEWWLLVPNGAKRKRG